MKQCTIWNISVLLFPFYIIVMAYLLTAVVAHPTFFAILGFFLMVVGAVLLFLARLPLYRRGIFWSIGPSQLPKKSQLLWKLAYFLFLPGGIICTLGLFIL